MGGLRKRPVLYDDTADPHGATPGTLVREEDDEVCTLPEQYYSRPDWTPEQRLQEAVLKDAVDRYRSGEWMEMEWFEEGDSSYPFSAAAICRSLGLDLDAVLCKLKGGGKDL